MNATLTNLPDILTAKELQEVLRISRAGAYNLLNSKDFPTLHIGNRKLVTKENLLRWMEQNSNNSSAKTTL